MLFGFCSPQIEKSLEDYMALSLEEVAESEVPMMFVSFPSAKDPSWGERNPGTYIHVHIHCHPY